MDDYGHIPLFAQPRLAAALLGLSITRVYRLLADDVLKATKCGGITLIDMKHAAEALRALPPAKIELPMDTARRRRQGRIVTPPAKQAGTADVR
jgi:hypothetical protein